MILLYDAASGARVGRITETQLDALIGLGSLASRIPVLLIAAEDSQARRMWAVEVGAVAYVTKPVDGRLLARYITKVLEAG